MDNIVQAVYTSLKTSTEEIGKAAAERDALEAKIKENRYTSETLKNEIFPKKDALRAKVRDGISDALAAARGLVREYEGGIESRCSLDPAEITPDLQLLQSGIPMTEKDIKSMLSRNAKNKTMVQLILRFAEAHNISTGGTFFVAADKERETAKNLYSMIDLYSKYLDRPDGLTVLDQFFGMGG